MAQKNFAIRASRPITPGNGTSPGNAALIACSGDGWVRLILTSGQFVEMYVQTGITYVADIHVRAVDSAAAFTPLAANVVVNVVDY
jgi:hypothetical protein